VTQAMERKIRSFVRREGRMTRAQQDALARLGDAYLISGNDRLDLDVVFGRRAPRVMEIGFGMGDSLAAMAKADPHRDYLGVEVHRPGIGSLIMKLEQDGIDNVRIISTDAVEVLQYHLPDACLDALQLFFPDPWPKKRHHKRRLVQPAFVNLLGERLRPGGRLHLATDWENYALQMLEVMEAAPGFENEAGAGQFSPRPSSRPLTKFEQRGGRLGHGVWDLLYRREGA
jgi:tRNA (guanine-N7-)-methyltransferase